MALIATVDRLLRELKGAARKRYLDKWGRWLREIFREKFTEEVGTQLGAVERYLLEHCSGLDDNECYQELSERAGRPAREEDYLEEVCRYKQALEQELGYSNIQQALRDYIRVDDPDRLSAIEEYINATFQCLYQLPIRLNVDIITRIGVPYDWKNSLEEAAQLCIELGWEFGRFRDVWDISPLRRRYGMSIVRQMRPCLVFYNMEWGIIWVATCDYVLANEKKRVCVAYKFTRE